MVTGKTLTHFRFFLVCQEIADFRVLPDGMGKEPDTLFFHDSVSGRRPAHADPNLYPCPRLEPPPAGRLVPASSAREMRTCALCSSDALRAVLRHEKSPSGTQVPQRA